MRSVIAFVSLYGCLLTIDACSSPHAHRQSGGSVAPALPHGPIIIAHRGASGHRPEHTIEGYALAIAQGADYIEPDLVVSRDGVLIARHENEIGGTTDVAAKFPERRTTKVIDGDTVRGWFTEDFTIVELKQLRARERLPSRSHAFDGLYEIPTFDEVLELIVRKSRESGRMIGVYPETKHPSYFRSIGLPLEERLIVALSRYGLDRRSSPVFIQSFEVDNLKRLRGLTRVQLVQLVASEGVPWDRKAAGDSSTYRDMTRPGGLAAIARYADGVGLEKVLVQPVNRDGALQAATTVVRDAHAAGLVVHVWTLRRDPSYLPRAYDGDPVAEWVLFAKLGVDGMFGDFPDDGVAARRR